MTRLVLKVPPRAWLLQTAAGSALGRMVIRLGRPLENIKAAVRQACTPGRNGKVLLKMNSAS
jgi:hypothetical protein